jgi:hypothetical protein
VTTLAAGTGQAWESAAFLAAGNLLVAIDGNRGDVSFPPLDGDMTFGNVTVHLNQTMRVTLTLDKSHATAAVSMTKTITSANAQGAPLGSTSEVATATIDVDFCPDTGGVSPGTITVTGDGTVTPAGGGAPSAYHVQVTGTYKINVNDQAATSSIDLTGAVDYSTSGAVPPVAVSATFSGANLSIAVQRAVGPQGDVAVVERSTLMVPMLASTVAEGAAKKKWQGGACVAVQADPASMTVAPSATVTVTATPFQKFAMAQFNAPVVATLSGVQSLAPQNQAVMSPATFTYVAGGKPGDQGTVSLKSTSKRGIGTGSVTYTVECPAGTPTTCPAGQTLNRVTCMCEGCFIDPTTGNPSSGCTWSGTINVTGSNAGSLFDGITQWDWDFEYQASFSVVSAAGAVAGPVTGSWHEVGATVFVVGGPMCTVTNTTDDTFSGTQQAQLGVGLDNGQPLLMRLLLLPRSSGLDGTFTTQVSDALCGSNSSRADHVSIDLFDGTATPTPTTFTGTSVNPIGPPLPSGGDAALNVSWNLTVVPISSFP